MSKKKVIHLITGLEVGGTEIMLSKILPLLQSDFENYVICVKGEGPIAKVLRENNIPVYYLKLRHILDIRALWRIRTILKNIHPDIISTYLIHADILGRLISKPYGVKKVICNKRGNLENWQLLEKIDWLTKSLVTHYTVQTSIAKNNLIKDLNIPPHKITIIPNGIPMENISNKIDKIRKSKELAIPFNNLNITCVGRLKIIKGHYYLLEAFEKVFSKNKKINLLIVGDGEQKNNLIKQAVKYSSKDNIFFLGARNDVSEILSITDLFVLPTLGEGMSNAIIEAMSHSIPVITTDIPENTNLITHNKEGLLVKPKSSDDISTSLESLLQNSTTKLTLGRNAKKKALKYFNIVKTTDRIKALYHKIIEV